MNECDLRRYLIKHLWLRKEEICPVEGKPYSKIQLFLDNELISSVDIPVI